ncbi:hypothetical protein GETHLI_34160 [Geothrix limicola]|uniref:PNPLA domain-containing protein n=2 Tax=Geothrix limicola TaxID=2927978 RepID=A0ABQ5QK13_9BACT|nr:hypothetical protein GETHLI_34160 [Geothrix limicola]
MRGLYTASYLDHFATYCESARQCAKLDIGASFDLIVGTSTGAILAAALATGCKLSRVRELYKKWGPSIFPEPLPSSLLSLLWHVRKRKSLNRTGAEALRLALSEVFGTTTLGDVFADRRIGICIPAVELGHHHPRVFKSAHHQGLDRRDERMTLVDACLASSAAPIYRSLASVTPTLGNGPAQLYVDGGLWANNPVLVGLVDALEIRGDSTSRPIEIYSIGTCPSINGGPVGEADLDWGFSEWQFGGRAASLGIDAQASAYDKIVGKISKWLPNIMVARFPTFEVPLSVQPYLALDETSMNGTNALEDLGRNHATELRSLCMDPKEGSIQSLNRLFMETIQPVS